MIRVTAKLICILAGLCCLLALADRWGWTEPLWAKCWPAKVLPRPLSPAELQAATLEGRIAGLGRDLAATAEARDQLARRRGELLGQLRVQAAAARTARQPASSTERPGRVYRVAVYGETAGFDLKKRADEFTVAFELPCWQGEPFDKSIARFVAADTDVLFIGGDNTFSRDTARAIERAVHDDGKVLVINFWSQRCFEASLPAVNRGNAPYGSHLVLADPQHAAMTGLPGRFDRQGRDYNREKCSARDGSTVLLRYADGDPALLYWRYGKGYVVEWTLECIGAFLPGDTADTINYRLLKMLLAESTRGKPLPAAQRDEQPVSIGMAADPGRLLKDNPIAAALVRSIDAEDRRDAELCGRQVELASELDRLKARLIALRNGVSLTDTMEPSGPTDELRVEAGDESVEARYERIIREAANTN